MNMRVNGLMQNGLKS